LSGYLIPVVRFAATKELEIDLISFQNGITPDKNSLKFDENPEYPLLWKSWVRKQ
jgi:hypothetical protein